MALLGFKPQFVDPIQEEIKDQTLRDFRKVPILPFEHLYLYTGLRTKHCKKIGEAQCTGVYAIQLRKNSYTIHNMMKIKVTDRNQLNQFAQRDGFKNWKDLQDFWYSNHGKKCFPWSGIIIHFTLLPKSAWKKTTSKERKLLIDQFTTGNQ